MQVILHLACFDRLAVDAQAFVLITDLVTRNTDNPFDVIHRRVFRIAEDHHIAPFGLVDADDFLVDHRQTDTIGEFVNQDEIANLQGRNHRTRRNLERLNDK